ncbi:MAG: kelch repeat-containing protein [Candidatus Promineifilaceae bacterium]|nr:kelch repeat-containing protein [Candidatus Promineifilaceae bacterium]
MPDLGEPISERELDVLNCLTEGATNREIAEQLSISPNTVKVHLRNIYTKLGVSSRTEATTVALQKGVVSIPGIEVEAEEEALAADAAADAVAEVGAEVPPPSAGTAVEGAAAPVAPTDGAPMEVVPVEGAPAVSSGRSGDGSDLSSVLAARDLAGAASSEPRGRRLALLAVGATALLALLLGGLAVASLWRQADGASPDVAEGAASDDVEPAVEVAEEPLGENWLAVTPALPEPRAHMAVASVGLNLYQIGGETADGIVNSVAIYDTQRQVWGAGAPKITPVADAGAAVLAGEIYVVGGQLETGQATNSVEAYSPLNDGWRPVTPLPQPVAGGFALASDGLLYFFGGVHEETIRDSAYVYDPATQAWETLPPLVQARAFAAGGVINGELYVVGGTDGEMPLSSCERFDPAAGRWSSCPPMQVARSGAAAGVVLKKLYLFGGSLGEPAAVGERYDATSEGWEEIEMPMLSAAPDWPFLGASSVETRIYLLGGVSGGEPADKMYIYTPQVYQFFIPSASSGRGN